MVLTVEKNI